MNASEGAGSSCDGRQPLQVYLMGISNNCELPGSCVSHTRHRTGALLWLACEQSALWLTRKERAEVPQPDGPVVGG